MATLGSILNIYSLPTGRRIIALNTLRAAAHAAGHTALVTRADQALQAERTTAALELKWQLQKNAPVSSPSELTKVDSDLDQTLAGIHGTVSSVVNAALPGQPVEAARKVLDTFFPAGLAALTRGTHAEQSKAVRASLDAAGDPGVQAAIKALNLSAAVQRVDELATRMAQLLSAAVVGPSVTWAQVQDAQRQSLSSYEECVARVVGLHPTNSDADALARAKLLEGVLKQGEAFAEAHRRARGPVDVNPDTGEPAGEVTG